jgi:hypothetical protein
MPKDEEGRQRGSFYRLTVDRITKAYPNKSPAWHRMQAREVLDAVKEAGSSAALPMWTREDIERLKEDFGTPAEWKSARGAGEASVQVAVNNGIVGMRNSSNPDVVLLLTISEFRELIEDIVDRRFNFTLPEDDLRAGQSRMWVEQLSKLPEEGRNKLRQEAAALGT